jgi:hypothetical protein
MEEQLVGTVTHYYGKPHVAVIKLSGEVNQGDVLRFHGHTTDFQQPVGSMEVEHGHIESAGPGTEVAIQVDERVREHDQVFKVNA